jgi:hypothetical protein
MLILPWNIVGEYDLPDANYWLKRIVLSGPIFDPDTIVGSECDCRLDNIVDLISLLVAIQLFDQNVSGGLDTIVGAIPLLSSECDCSRYHCVSNTIIVVSIVLLVPIPLLDRKSDCQVEFNCWCYSHASTELSSKGGQCRHGATEPKRISHTSGASSPKGKLCCGGCGRRTITFLNTNSFEKSIWTPSTPSTGWEGRRRLCRSIGKILSDNTSLRSVKRDKQRMGNTSTQWLRDYRLWTIVQRTIGSGTTGSETIGSGILFRARQQKPAKYFT